MKYKKLIILLSLSVFIGCQEIVDVEIEEGPSRLVVEGRIEKYYNIGYQVIKLSTTDEYFSNSNNPPASGASILVSDGTKEYEFAESNEKPGYYETDNLFPEIGRKYTLTIIYNGEVFEGSETLVPVAKIDTVYQEKVEESVFDEEGIRLRIDYTDPAETEDYYFWEQFRNGETLVEANGGTKWTLISSDDFYNGRKVIGKQPNDEIIYYPGDVAYVKQIGISKFQFDYYWLLFEQAASGGFFSPPSAAAKGNIKNLTNPVLYPLGYFGASEVKSVELVIE